MGKKKKQNVCPRPMRELVKGTKVVVKKQMGTSIDQGGG